jgi:hypothetical protein
VRGEPEELLLLFEDDFLFGDVEEIDEEVLLFLFSSSIDFVGEEGIFLLLNFFNFYFKNEKERNDNNKKTLERKENNIFQNLEKS